MTPSFCKLCGQAVSCESQDRRCPHWLAPVDGQWNRKMHRHSRHHVFRKRLIGSVCDYFKSYHPGDARHRVHAGPAMTAQQNVASGGRHSHQHHFNAIYLIATYPLDTRAKGNFYEVAS